MHHLFTKLPLVHKTMISVITAIVVMTLFFLPDVEELKKQQTMLEVGKAYPLAIPQQIFAIQTAPQAMIRWESHKVKSGESAALLFSRIGLSAQLLHKLINTNDDIKQQLSRLRPGDELRFGFDEHNRLTQLIRPISTYEAFRITKVKDDFISHLDKKEINTHLNYSEAEISSNFWNAAISAGLTPNQIMELAGIFGWDIDFALDIRSGDKFEVLFEEKYVEGKNIGQGKILAARFINQGSSFTAILNPDDSNYYEQDGHAMRKTFLRSPIDFRRVTSNFNPTRRHPVTGRIVAHRGTDYAAPVGTPIWAAGDGIVERAGYNQFNGNYVFIRHSTTYMTKYLHMQKRYAKQGQRVKQGQTIGTLGGTGRVTGPHLHYEFLVHGVHKNPRTVSLPQAKSLTGDKKKAFLPLAEKRLAQLSQYGRVYVATR